MSAYTEAELAAYKDGLDAAHRSGPHENATLTPDCPHAAGSSEAKAWWEGFGDGTEDLIALQRSDE